MPAGKLRDPRRLLATPLGVSLLRMDLSLDLYAQNPLRIIVRPAWVTDEESDALTQRFRNLYRLRPQIALQQLLHFDYAQWVELRNPLDLLNDLREPPRRLVWELFWLHLDAGNFAKISANRRWTIPHPLPQFDSTESSTDAALWVHALAVLYHNQALTLELTNLKNALEHRASAEGFWRKSLESWAATIGNPFFWEYIQNRIEILDDPRLTPAILEPLRAELPEIILSFNSVWVRAYIGAGYFDDAARHLRLIGENFFPGPIQQKIFLGLLREITNAWLNPFILQLENNRPQQSASWPVVRDWLTPILDAAAQIPPDLKAKFSLDELIIADIPLDNLAEKIFALIDSEIIDYQPSRPRTILFLILICRRILELPLSPSLRRRIEERRGTYIENLYGRFYNNAHHAREIDPTQCWFLPGELSDPEQSLLLPVYKPNPRGKITLWDSQEVLIPRSRLAEMLHFGKVSEVQEQLQADSLRLMENIDTLRRELDYAQQNFAILQTDALAAEEAYCQIRQQLFDTASSSAAQAIQNRIQEITAQFQARLTELAERQSEAQTASKGRWAPSISENQAILTRFQSIKNRTLIDLPLAMIFGIAVAISISSLSRAWAFYLLRPLELFLRDNFQISDRGVNYLPLIVAVLLTVIMSVVVTEIVLGRKIRRAQRSMEKIARRQEQASIWVEQMIQEQRELILREQEAQLREPLAKLAAINNQQATLTEKISQTTAEIKNYYDGENSRRAAFFEERLTQLTQRLDNSQIASKSMEDKIQFPAYCAALKNGYLPGEHPPHHEPPAPPKNLLPF